MRHNSCPALHQQSEELKKVADCPAMSQLLLWMISAPIHAGVAVLGRGGSAMPAQHVAGLGPRGGLMQLASEAVRAAAQSPFLERAVGRATAVLCCVYLPDRGLPSPGAVSSGYPDNAVDES